MYIDANHIQHASHDAACEYYGADTAASLAAEDAYDRAQTRAHYEGMGYLFSADGNVMMAPDYAEEMMDRMSAGEIQPTAEFDDGSFDDIPF